MSKVLIACKLLSCADSYLRNADKLIYSYGSRTFLSGYTLFDPEHYMRGNIDCSTFVILVLSGIPYEESPYVKGQESLRFLKPAAWAEQDLFDFAKIPERYIEIAERIGRPYLAGPKGLDLKKAEEMGISLETLKEEIRRSSVVRRSVLLADYYQKKGACFSDSQKIRPGDLVFFSSEGFFKEGDRIFEAEPEINHVGIAAEDTEMMIHSSGKGPAVSKSLIFGERKPVLFARPEK